MRTGKAADREPPLVKYGLTADEAARDPIATRHVEVAETDREVQAALLARSLRNLAALRRAGRL